MTKCPRDRVQVDQCRILLDEEDAYKPARRQALTLLDQGFHLGGAIRVTRDELHERTEPAR